MGQGGDGEGGGGLEGEGGAASKAKCERNAVRRSEVTGCALSNWGTFDISHVKRHR